jgi:hypothetical protein
MTTLNVLNSHTADAPLPQTFNTSSVSVWFEAECVSLLSLLVMIGSNLDMTLV